MRKIIVEPAKSGKSTCKNCHKGIDDGTLRVHIFDGREFYAALRRDGGGHEGVSRGYIEGYEGRVVSIKKYYVHLNCYRPIGRKHPYTAEYFDTKKCTKQPHKQAFDAWLKSKQGSASSASKPAAEKKSAS